MLSSLPTPIHETGGSMQYDNRIEDILLERANYNSLGVSHTDCSCNPDMPGSVSSGELSVEQRKALTSTIEYQGINSDRPRSLGTTSDRQLPVEILDHIFAYADGPSLFSLSTCSHKFNAISTRILYRHIPSTSLSRTVKCLRTLASNADLASHTCIYEIGDMDWLNADTLLDSFFRLLRRAFHNMPNLSDLTYLLYGSTARALRGAPFHLIKLTASCDFDPAFANWLEGQHTLRTALFCGRYSSGASLSLNSLPALSRVSASPLILASVVPGRPVREIELCLVHPWQLNEEVLSMTVKIVSFSTGPVRSLQIISHLTESVDTVLAALRVIPSTMSTLDSLALHAEFLAGLPPILSSFTCLKSLVLLSKNKHDALHDHITTCSLPSIWNKACASLESISLPNATWVRNYRYGWLTLKDLEKLLLEREKALMKREWEVREKEEALNSEQRALEEREQRLVQQIRMLEAVGSG
ncbi:hypothetical protein EW146_g6978 [Bondarzewia mesenterica]|uniref:F-box domain-containing protein n=1 Tax=Bondarzewia mesenterica TaxID=1095465 RepID=A0A4S4LSS2_9AGAM|nr:hypothetical protein EW146_g6978 [Bondarzewia mesenterica]